MLRRSGNFTRHRQMCRKGVYLVCAHFLRMFFIVKKNISFNEIVIDIFGSMT